MKNRFLILRSRRVRAVLATGICAASIWLVPSARASLLENDLFDTTQTTFDANILNNDLIENGSGGLSGGAISTGSVASYGGDVAPYNSFSNLTDGLASTKVTNNDISHDTYFDGASYSTNPSITYNFNLTANPGGYALTQIRSIEGWADSRSFADQRYTVSISQVGSPSTFNVLKDVTYTPFADNNGTANSSQVTLTDTTGILASGVAAIKFTFLHNLGASDGSQVFREIDVSTSTSYPPPPPPPPPGPSVLPLGDSITYGDGVAGGYRTQLFNRLKAADPSHTPTFLGTQTGNASATLSAAGQIHNEGHDGYRIDNVAAALDGPGNGNSDNGGHWLSGPNGGAPIYPAFILLHIGTNDILQGNSLATIESRLSSLVNQILSDRPLSHLLLASIIPINVGSDNAEVQQYDSYINTLAGTLKGAGKDVTFVDQYAGFVNPDGSIKTALLQGDGVHPSQAGYDTMGNAYATAMATVPEPGAVSLLLSSVAILLGVRRRARV